MTVHLVNFLNGIQGLRKSIVMIALIAITAAFRAKGLIDPSNFEGLLKATVIAYFGSNSIEHYSAMVKANLESKNSKPVIEITSTTEEG